MDSSQILVDLATKSDKSGHSAFAEEQQRVGQFGGGVFEDVGGVINLKENIFFNLTISAKQRRKVFINRQTGYFSFCILSP